MCTHATARENIVDPSRTLRVQPRTSPSKLIIIDASLFALARRLCAWGPRLCVWTTHNIIQTYGPTLAGVPSLKSSCALRQAPLATPRWISSHTVGTMYLGRRREHDRFCSHKALCLRTQLRDELYVCTCAQCISVRSSRTEIRMYGVHYWHSMPACPTTPRTCSLRKQI